MFYKRARRLIVGAITLLLQLSIMLGGCSAIPKESNVPYYQGFSVHFIDVGQGDSAFIKLPDGKTVLIDCGICDDGVYKSITSALAVYSVNKIDYLVLTHPDSDHVGNAYKIITDYQIGAVISPNVYYPQNFESFNLAYQLIIEKEIPLIYATFNQRFGTSEYAFTVLMPDAPTIKDGVYADYLSSSEPTDTQINNLSVVIYLEYAGVRFLFTGDMQYFADGLLTDNYLAGIYNFNNGTDRGVNLNEIDFLKVAHHGAKDRSSEKVLSVVKPKNAVISVGGQNSYRHPSTETITRLLTSNPACNILRTDYYGDISVSVSNSGDISISTQSQR